ncbi:MAG: ATP-binding protein [Pseudomonadota bacterium]
MSRNVTAHVIVASDAAAAPALEPMLCALEAADWCDTDHIEASAALRDPDRLRGAACIVLVLSDMASHAAGDALPTLTRRVTPTPVIVMAPQIESCESSLFACGVDDCLNPDVIPVPATLRVIRRSIERASQRVHVETATQQYHDLFDHMPVAAFSVDAKACVTAANREFLNMLGAADAGDVTDVHLNGLLTGLANLLKRARDGEIVEYKQGHIVESLDGFSRHVVVFARRSADSGEAPVMDVYLTDVTEQEVQTRRVAAAESRLRQLTDNVPVMMFLLDRDRRVFDANRRLVDALGLERHALEGMPFTSLLHPDTDIAAVRSSIDRVFGGGAEHEQPVSMLRPDGSEMECLFSAQPGSDGAGRVSVAHAMLVDVTDRNHAQRDRDRLQEQLQLTRKLESIGELAAGIAHEINTPAQYVSDNLSFLREGFEDLHGLLATLPGVVTSLRALEDSAPADALESAVDAADLEYLVAEIPAALAQGQDGIAKIREIVLALKEFSHPGGGDMEAADLNRVIESTVTVARNEWKYIAEIERCLSSDLPRVECYPSAIAQVVLNLLVNAAHAIGDARDEGDPLGQIRIATARHGDDAVCFRISDNGPGVSDEIRHKIFDPFFTTKEVGRGTGQGLAISRSVITEQHGGDILLDSAPGRGTTFTVILPLSGAGKDGIREAAA